MRRHLNALMLGEFHGKRVAAEMEMYRYLKPDAYK
jgi:hypothetical protein